jgi:molybdopterin molybdotransferase
MKTSIAFAEALELTLAAARPCGAEIRPLLELGGRILAENAVANVDSPSVTVSRKDGYAVVSTDLAAADTDHPVTLKVIGRVVAGEASTARITPSQAIRITTGAPIPAGADAVIAEEFCLRDGDRVICTNTAEPGRNMLPCGVDIRCGETIVRKGEKLTPPVIGLLASAGLDRASVYRSPHVAVLATGDEVVAPGRTIVEGKLYASNMVEICAWLSKCGMSFSCDVVRDRPADLFRAIETHLPAADAVITSGGAWGSERDLILKSVAAFDWHGIYHRVRMGPGKAVGFGLLANKPFFILPGGPPSNETAFLQLALPALVMMKGDDTVLFPTVRARLTKTVPNRDPNWTRFIHARIEKGPDGLTVTPAQGKSRLQSMARKQGYIILPEGKTELHAGESIAVQLLCDPGTFFL